MSNAHDADAKVAELEAKVERLEEHIFTLQEIKDADDLPERFVPMPEWGKGGVIVKGLSLADFDEATRRAKDPRTGETDEKKHQEILICWGSVKPKITPDTYPTLVKKSAGAVNRMLKNILDASGLGKEAEERAKAAFRG
jgi:hypothetical protein